MVGQDAEGNASALQMQIERREEIYNLSVRMSYMAQQHDMHSADTCKLRCGHVSLFCHTLAFGADTHLIAAKGSLFLKWWHTACYSPRLTIISPDLKIIT